MRDEDLVAALLRVERHGDVSASHDPASHAMRARMEREFLATRDYDTGRLVLTSMGRQRLSRRGEPARGIVMPFKGPAKPGHRD
jgi:hypothetical protein